MKYCPACGSENIDIAEFCSTCGSPIITSGLPRLEVENKETATVTKSGELGQDNSHVSEPPNLAVMSIVSAIAGVFFWGIGFYKYLAYGSGDLYPYTSVNAYVGGDAYNFIINGTYFTAFAVIGSAFIIGAFILYGFSIVIKNQAEHNIK